MKTTNLIALNAYRAPSPAPAATFNLSEYEQRGIRRYRRASLCSIISTVVDCVTSLVIGACVLACVLLVFTML